MGLGRRLVTPEQHDRWVYNRMDVAYAARPDYPPALIARLSALAGPVPAQIADLGAGLGHLSLPLAALGHHVQAIEPACAMLRALEQRARDADITLHTVHAAAESLPLTAASVDLVVVADALHFLDAHRTGLELARVLRARGRLAFVRVSLGTSPYMRALQALMQEAAPRRPKPTADALLQVAALCDVTISVEERFACALPLTEARLEGILRSISFIGPAMNPARFADFFARVRALPGPPVWETSLCLSAGGRGSGQCTV